MQASRRPRRSFAAPLILISAAAAGSACVVASTPSSKPVTTKDHRTTEATPEDHRGGDDTGPIRTNNPPPPNHTTGDHTSPDQTGAVENAPDETTHQGDAPNYQRNWSISMDADGDCFATMVVACKKGQKCDPSKPVAMASCPVGITAGGTMSIYAQSGSWDCFIMPAASSCPEKATCNPPPPKKTACPK
jgi:hypothetical protein